MADREPYRRRAGGENCLPEGLYCGDCARQSACALLFGSIPEDEVCDWIPIRFVSKRAVHVSAEFLIQEMIGEMKRINLENEETLQAIYLHPDDYLDVTEHVAVRATTADARFGGPLAIWGVRVMPSKVVARGQIATDPPRFSRPSSVAEEKKT